MTKIVISYRREDTQAATHMLFERLKSRFGHQSVFLDFDSIGPGDDFRNRIKSVLDNCDVVLVMIGPRWRSNAKGSKSRLGDPTDWVRFEIETAFENGSWIIPVLIDGTSMPTPQQLPESIRNLAYLNAVRVDTGVDFAVHSDRLLRSLGDRLIKDDGTDTGLHSETVSEPVAANGTAMDDVPPPEPHHDPVRGTDVESQEEITLEEAFGGAVRTISSPDGTNVEVRIPRGTRSGDTLCVLGAGNPGQFGGAPGDRIVAITIARHETFTLLGGDLETSISISAGAAANGTAAQLSTFSGPFLLPIPANCSDGARLRLKGRGLPAHAENPAGDLYVWVNVVRDAKAPVSMRPASAADKSIDPNPPATRGWGVAVMVLGLLVIVFAGIRFLQKSHPSQDTTSTSTTTPDSSSNPAAPASDTPAQSAPATPAALSSDESNAVSSADTAALQAAQRAGEGVQEMQVAKNKAADAKNVSNAVTFSSTGPPPGWTTTLPWTYVGDHSGPDASAFANGLGVKTWTAPAATCAPESDGSPGVVVFEGEFVQGQMEGAGVFHHCGSVYSGYWSNSRPNGLGVSILSKGPMYQGSFVDGTPTLGVKTNPSGSAIVSEQGEMAGKLNGYGVVSCSNGNKWKGHWADGNLSGYAVEFDQNWTVLAHGNYGSDSGQTTPPELC